MAKKRKQEGGASVSKKLSLVQKWNNYFKKGDLDDWRRLCADLGLPDDLPSKKKCRIVSFLLLPSPHRLRKCSPLTPSLHLGPQICQRQYQAVPQRKVEARGRQVLPVLQRALPVHYDT